MSASPSGLLVLDKTAGVTSYDCVHQVKRVFGIKRVGHCGTLDPLARGVLLILVGPATRQQDSLLAQEKQYWFRAEFGRRTDTGDREGQVTEVKPWGPVTRERLESVLGEFVGETQQVPPLYAALKYRGKPYYYYARRGLPVPRVPRPITIVSLSLVTFSPPYWEARVVCSRGTYVRSLVEDVAVRLGTVATLTELVRERVGPYTREQAISWEQLCHSNRETLSSKLNPLLPSEGWEKVGMRAHETLPSPPRSPAEGGRGGFISRS